MSGESLMVKNLRARIRRRRQRTGTPGFRPLADNPNTGLWPSHWATLLQDLLATRL
jgi:hypothetical protein